MPLNIIHTVATFEKAQWIELNKWVLFHHRKDSDLFKVFSYFKTNKEQLNLIPRKEEIRVKYFTNISHKRFLNLLSSLNLIIEDFILHDHLKKTDYERDLLLNKIYNAKGLFKKADQKARKIDRTIKADEKISLIKMKAQAQIAYQQYYSDNPTKYKDGDKLLDQVTSHELINSKLKLLLYQCELINWGLIRKIDYRHHTETIDQISKLIPDGSLSMLLVELQSLLKKPNVEKFTKLLAVLYSGDIKCPSDLHTILTMYLITCSIRLWLSDLQRDADTNIKLFEYALDNKVLMYNGKIPIIRFHNLVNTVGVLQSFEWTNAFIHKWKFKVAGSSIESTSNLALAQNAFIHENYEQIYPLIIGMEFENFFQKAISLSLELVVLYKDRAQNYALLKNFLNNFKRTLKRNRSEISENFFSCYLNFIKVIELLVKKDFTRITINLKNYDKLLYRSWLEKQL